jgi:hypothetical protein
MDMGRVRRPDENRHLCDDAAQYTDAKNAFNE